METIKWIQTFSSPFLDHFFVWVTMLGEESFYLVLLGFVFWCVEKKFGYKIAFAFLLSSVVNGIVKNFFRASRPLDVKELRHLRVETATGYSFPSGHTQNITAFLTSLMRKIRGKVFCAAACACIVLVAVSRLYLGVHWPSDVLGAVFLGTACVFLSDLIFDRIEKINRKGLFLIVILPTLAAMVVFNDSADLMKASGVFLSFITGYLIEEKYIKFNSKALPWKQLIKFIFGISMVFIIKTVLKKLLPVTTISDFLRYFVIGFCMTVVMPWLFKLLRLTDSEIKN